MLATIFSGKKIHTETCQFIEWKPIMKSMGRCDKKAMGKIGKEPVCQEYFDYACALQRLERSVER